MGYVVVTFDGSNSSSVDRIPKGVHSKVIEGHLFISDAGNRSIAVYAPANWKRAYRDAEVTLAYHGEGIYKIPDPE